LALEDILRALEEKTKARVEAITMEGRQRVKEIMTDVERESAHTRRLTLKKVEGQVRSEATVVVYSASLKARSELIKAQEEVVGEAFRIAEQRLLALHQDESYSRIFEILLDESLQYLSGEVVLEVREDDRALAKELMAARKVPYSVSDTPLEVSGGLIAGSADGDVTVFNTFESRLDKARDKLKLEISSALFEA